MPKFIDFMNDKQRDPRLNEMLFPSYGEKRCMEIINKYETNEENKKNSKLKVTHTGANNHNLSINSIKLTKKTKKFIFILA